MSTDTELEATYEALNDAIKFHVAEIRGIPMTPSEVLARFTIYGAILYHFYGMSMGDIGKLLSISEKMEPNAVSVPHTIGKPN